MIPLIPSQSLSLYIYKSYTFSYKYHQHHVMPVTIVLHGHVAPHSNYFELRNVMVPLIMPLTSHDTTVNAYGITCLKRSCCTSFQLS